MVIFIYPLYLEFNLYGESRSWVNYTAAELELKLKWLIPKKFPFATRFNIVAEFSWAEF